MTYIPDINNEEIPPCIFGPVILNIMTYPGLAKKDIGAMFRKESARLLREIVLSEDIAVMDSLKKQNPMLEGMINLVLDIPSDEDEKMERFKRGLLAGEILFYILKFDRNGYEGSVSKSVHILENIRKISKSKLMKIWREFKSVSYYYAAMTLIFRECNFNPIKKYKTALSEGKDKNYAAMAIYSFCFYAVINLSMHLCQWATERVEKRTRQPLLDIHETWTVPKEFIMRAWDHCKLFGFSNDSFSGKSDDCPLSQEERSLLESYKANLKY